MSRRAPIALVLAASSLVPRAARADEEADRLFQDARAAMAERRFDAACALFELSFARDGAEGARVNLALCEAARKKYVRAEGLLVAADHALEARGIDGADERRLLVARERADLTKRAPRLRIELAQGAGQVELDGTPVEPGKLGAPFIVDPGVHSVTLVDAAGRSTQSVTVTEGETSHVSFATRPAIPPPPPPEEASGPHPSVWVLGSLSLAALTAGIVTGALGLAEKDDVDRLCEEPYPGQDLCTSQEGVDAAARGTRFAIASTVSFIGAGVLTGVTVGLWVGLPTDAPSTSTTQLTFRGTF